MEKLGKLFADVARCHSNGVHNEVSKLGVGRGMPPMLGYIRHHNGCKQSELCKNGHISAATVTVMLQSMEKNGFITRCTDKDDQRCVRLYITPKGEETERLSRDMVESFDQEFFSCLTDGERAALGEILAKLSEHHSCRRDFDKKGENA